MCHVANVINVYKQQYVLLSNNPMQPLYTCWMNLKQYGLKEDGAMF